MADERKGLNVPIRATGRKDVQRVMRGVVADAEKAARESAKAQQAAEREAQKAVARAESAKRKEREKSARESAKQAQKGALAEKRVEDKSARERLRLERFVQRQLAKSITDLSRHRIREAEKTRRAEERIAAQAARKARREQARAAQRRVGFRRSMISGAATVGGAAIGGGMAAVGVARGAQGALGIRSQEEVLGSAINSRVDLIRQASVAGLDRGQTESIFNQASDIGQRTGLGPEQIISAISMNQELFSGLSSAVESNTLPAFMAQMENMAVVSMATGSEMSDVVTAAGEFQRQLSLSTDETADALAIIAQGAADGSLNMADFAGAFPGIISQLANLRGSEGRGIGTVREFQAIAQGLKAGGVTNAEAARTLQENLLNSFSNAETRGRIEDAGVAVMENELDADGNAILDDQGREKMRMRNTASILADMSRDSDFQGVNLSSILHDAQARNAATILMGQEQRAARGEGGALTLAQRQGASLEAGRESISGTFDAIMGSEVGGVLRDRATREAEVFRNMDELIGHYQQMNGWLTGLENKFPVLTAQVEAATSVISGLGAAAIATSIAMKMAGMGGAAATAASAAGVGTGAAAAGAGATGAAAAGGGMLGTAGLALAGAGVGLLTQGVFGGQGAGRLLADQINHDPSQGSRLDTLRGSMGRNVDPMAEVRGALERQITGGGDSEAARATDSQTRELVKELKKVAKAMERTERNTRPTGGASAGEL